MISKKYIFLFVFIVFISAPVLTKAADIPTASIAQQIEAIKQKIAELQKLLAELLLQKRGIEVTSGSYIVVDLLDGTVISEKSSGTEYPIASITKLMNAVVSLESIDQNQKITLTADMLKPVGYSPALFLGATVTAHDLLKAMMIQSTNDAAESLASIMGVEKFVAAMNQKAVELGMQETHFYDTHGLNLQNRSTAANLVKLVTYVYNNHPEVLTLSKETNFQLPGSDGRLLTFKNVNNFYGSPDFVGGKTGYLPEAKQSLASIFQVNGKTMAVIVLYSKDRQIDTIALINSIKSKS